MLGMSLPEIIIILIVAVIFLGPDKLPVAMMKVARFLKFFKQSLDEARSSFEQEIKIADLKEDSKKYKDSIAKTSSEIRKKLSFDELDDIKNTINKAKNDLSISTNNIGQSKNSKDSLENTSKNDL